jgi:hypothetical protein
MFEPAYLYPNQYAMIESIIGFFEDMPNTFRARVLIGVIFIFSE